MTPKKQDAVALVDSKPEKADRRVDVLQMISDLLKSQRASLVPIMVYENTGIRPDATIILHEDMPKDMPKDEVNSEGKKKKDE